MRRPSKRVSTDFALSIFARSPDPWTTQFMADLGAAVINSTFFVGNEMFWGKQPNGIHRQRTHLAPSPTSSSVSIERGSLRLGPTSIRRVGRSQMTTEVIIPSCRRQTEANRHGIGDDRSSFFRGHQADAIGEARLVVSRRQRRDPGMDQRFRAQRNQPPSMVRGEAAIGRRSRHRTRAR